MKVDTEARTESSAPTRQHPDGERFQRALQEATSKRPAPPTPSAATRDIRPVRPATLRPLPAAVGPGTARTTSTLLATSRGALSTPERLTVTRQAMHAESFRLGSVRGEAQTASQERTEHRLTDLLSRELSREPRAPAPPSSPFGTEPSAAPQEPLRTPKAVEGIGAEGRSPATGGAARSEAAPTSRVDSTMEVIERIEVFVKSQRPALSLSVRGTLDATVEVERTGPREVRLHIQGHHGPVPTEQVIRLRDALEARGLKLHSLRTG
ncbi:hypothetical protein [Myxococcus eversor]|uniref:hypothetical protein n=1 Tax=Myxococcus eversor TaxID=2709661 RepID=UPI0013D29E52|nr:hypothetical protein [Myxococcus eversor]